MAIFDYPGYETAFLGPPKDIISGAAFGLNFYVRAVLQSDWIKDTAGTPKSITVSVWHGNAPGGNMVWGYGSLPLTYLGKQDIGPGNITDYIYFYGNIFAVDFAQIEYFVRSYLQNTGDITAPFFLRFQGNAQVDGEFQDFTEDIQFIWNTTVHVPTVAAAGQYPSLVKVGEPFVIKNDVEFPWVIHDADAWDGYISLECVSESGEKIEFSVWHNDTLGGRYYPNTIKRTLERTINNIEQITGPLISPTHHYDIQVKYGYSSSGIIKNTNTPWQRSNEVLLLWSLDVVKGVPDPRFDLESMIYPPLSVGETDVFPIKVAVKNWWAPGVCYIECEAIEIWRDTLGEFATGAYQDTINYQDLPGNLGSDNHYTLTFHCGYIDESGNKVRTDTTVMSTYIVGGTVSLTIGDLGGGRTNPPSGTYSYNPDAIVPVRAIPDEGYVFQYWQGDVDQANVMKTSFNLIMDRDKVLSARFMYVGGGNGEESNIWPYLAIGGGLLGTFLLVKGGRK